MASSSCISFFDCEKLVGSLVDVARKEAQLADEKAKYVLELAKLTERNEILMKHQQAREMKPIEDTGAQAAMVVSLEEQSSLLKRSLEEKEDEITVLKKKLTAMEVAGHVGKIEEALSGSEAKSPMEVLEVKTDGEISGGERSAREKDLIDAARVGNLDKVKTLLAAGAGIEAADSEGLTPLMLAASRGHIDIVQTLLAAGAELEATDNEEWTPLMWAARYRSNLGGVQVLLNAGAAIEAADSEGKTPLILTSSRGNNDIAQILLAAGAELEATDNGGWTPFMHALNSRNISLVKTLLANGASIEASDIWKWTPLMWAAYNDDLFALHILLGAGASVDATSNNGWTPLMVAAYGGYSDFVQRLLAAGADVDAARKGGRLPFFQNPLNSRIADFVKKELLGDGILRKALDSRVWTPLMLAAFNGRSNVVQILLKWNPNITAVNDDGETALQIAEKEKQEDVVRILKNSGARR